MTREHPGIRRLEVGSKGTKGVTEALDSGGSWWLPSKGAVVGARLPSAGTQTQGSRSRRASSRTRFSSLLLRSSDRSRVVRGWPRPGQMAAVRAAGKWLGNPNHQAADLAFRAWGVRALMGPGLRPPRNRTECPQRTRLGADRMSRLRGGSLWSRHCVRQRWTECPWPSGMSIYASAPAQLLHVQWGSL